MISYAMYAPVWHAQTCLDMNPHRPNSHPHHPERSEGSPLRWQESFPAGRYPTHRVGISLLMNFTRRAEPFSGSANYIPANS